MPNSIASFIIFTILGFGIGFAGFELANKNEVASTETPTETAANTNSPADDHETDETEQSAPESVSVSSEILNSKGCLSCHAVASLDLEGGATGPDLSQAFTGVEDKHGKPLDEFLKEPTSAVMSSVISGNPLSDDEVQQIVDALQEASEK